MEKGKSIILVTGATGNQGGAVARHLLSRGHKVRALTRKPESKASKELSRLGAAVVQGDLDDRGSLEHALEGVWGVFAVQNTWEAGVAREEEQGKSLAEIARKKGVQHFVYTSVGSAHRQTGIPHFDNKWRIEETVRRVGFPSYTILRPVFFMDNFLTPWFKPGLMEGKLLIGIKPSTVLQMIAVDDVGKFGLRAFEQHKEMNERAIDIAGDQQTMPKTAEILSKAVGRKVEFVQVPIAEVRKFSEDYAIMLEWFDRVGYNVDIPKLSREYGIRLTTLAEWAGQARWA
ncbi:MAG: NmrA/HSCARG family protein [candidate division NC10 bacterium]|nr:NmrA/HSCARG family protein [candidate division NC10 bacterium]